MPKMEILLTFAFVLAATVALGQPETLSIERDRGLEGLWKISVPAGFSIGFSGPAKIRTHARPILPHYPGWRHSVS